MPTVSDPIKAQCVLWMHEMQSPTEVRRRYRIKYSINNGRDIPNRKAILSWYAKFKETGHLSSNTKRGRKRVDNCVQDIFRDDPGTSIRVASQQVPVSVGTVHNIVRKHLKLYPYNIQVVQALQPADYGKRHQFAQTMLTRMASGQRPSIPQQNLFQRRGHVPHIRPCTQTQCPYLGGRKPSYHTRT